MARAVEVLCRVLADRVVAAPDMTALLTQAEVYPAHAGGEAFLAPVGCFRVDLPDSFDMSALLGHYAPPVEQIW
jgi:hypothetical protein